MLAIINRVILFDYYREKYIVEVRVCVSTQQTQISLKERKNTTKKQNKKRNRSKIARNLVNYNVRYFVTNEYIIEDKQHF